MKKRMVIFPGAKINIGLRITGKRPDGYHDIETLFYPVPLCDALEFVIPEDQNSGDILIVTGIETGGEPEDNLVMKAVKKLREINSFPFLRMHLHKAIPVGAGLGGGSSNAACIIIAVNKYFGLNLDNAMLKSIALKMGSDCPFFIDCSPSFAGGRGEILVPDCRQVLKNYYMVLVNPGTGVNTGAAYRNCRPLKPAVSLFELTSQPLEKWKELIVNDFEKYVFGQYPHIKTLKDELYRSGAIFSLMSGSGSSVYGIFRSKPMMPVKLKDYVIWEGFL